VNTTKQQELLNQRMHRRFRKAADAIDQQFDSEIESILKQYGAHLRSKPLSPASTRAFIEAKIFERMELGKEVD